MSNTIKKENSEYIEEIETLITSFNNLLTSSSRTMTKLAASTIKIDEDINNIIKDKLQKIYGVLEKNKKRLLKTLVERVDKNLKISEQKIALAFQELKKSFATSKIKSSCCWFKYRYYWS